MITEELKEQANQMLLSMLKGVEKAAEFATAEIPLVVQELLRWHFVKSLMIFLVLLTIICVLLTGTYKLHKWLQTPFNEYRNNMSQHDMEFVYPLVILFGGGAFVGLVVALFKTLDWLQILIAPRLYLLEYAAGLVK